MGLTIIRRKWIFLLIKERKYLLNKSYIGKPMEIFWLLLEIFIILPHSTPFTQNMKVDFYTAFQFKSYYKLNEILNLILLLRIYIVARYFVIASNYYGNRAVRTCRFYAVEPNYWFTVKCMLKSHPYIIMLCSLLAVLLVCGEAVRICERFLF